MATSGASSPPDLLQPFAGYIDPGWSGAERQCALEHSSIDPEAGSSAHLQQARNLWKQFKSSEISSEHLRLNFLDHPGDNLASLLYLRACWDHAALEATDLEEQQSRRPQLLEAAFVDVCTHLAQFVPLASLLSLTARSLSIRLALAGILAALHNNGRCPPAYFFLKRIVTIEPRLHNHDDWLDPGDEVVDPKNKLDWEVQVSGLVHDRPWVFIGHAYKLFWGLS